ncbi:sec-independent translocase [Streptomyces radicis]|uniref:Sec-independent protein translocase protein TatB n=1 Tax=Streptomyces radicis TaxID=1750517 RepID=A0A3A9WHW5_9ACTN|nr:sec-independent translocase [Streptomyces radicis]RKN09034.1 Sec-independent protein translocase subunit TatB [Streptomyces radicis]RKN22775.1 Sec-independent protein translocase subunit TatB [Streptomyces radicis]
MFFDIGSLEFIVLLVLAILVFGPEKLPKMIQDAARFLRKIREFSDSAKADIRSELGPEFKDFEFEDLNPRAFAKKHLLDNDELGLKELTSSLDMRKELTEVTDAVNGRPARRTSLDKPGATSSKLAKGAGAAGAAAAGGGAVRLDKDGSGSSARATPPPFDADAT